MEDWLKAFNKAVKDVKTQDAALEAYVFERKEGQHLAIRSK